MPATNPVALSAESSTPLAEGMVMAHSAKQIGQMTDKELMKEWTALGKQVEKDRATLRDFSHEHQKRTRLAQLNLEPGDIELLQSTDVDGIESQEKVNG